MRNHHATAAQNLIQQDKAWDVGFETADAQHIISHIEAQVEATLALAYEQHTANLIALWSNPTTSALNSDSSWSVSHMDLGELLEQITERLGISG